MVIPRIIVCVLVVGNFEAWLTHLAIDHCRVLSGEHRQNLLAIAFDTTPSSFAFTVAGDLFIKSHET
jgi:hypothetical protein